MKKFIITFLMLLVTGQLFAQNENSAITDSLYASGKIYVVVVCVAVILLGLIFFMFSVDSRLKKVEKKSADKN
ncbi:CcmD family protein [Pedobacter sp. MC2016-14]|uniref:CcmD family protein n=1 Tax=Pedobacter sp. MC2016-14 TaxID=2897327 RepID=UPI001E59799D|nr:CcmD family protein [Pedobacter sp. MC2016-14]MCD0488498.1 CcmD family protein [Pedobacter sp. MC2016-14]